MKGKVAGPIFKKEALEARGSISRKSLLSSQGSIASLHSVVEEIVSPSFRLGEYSELEDYDVTNEIIVQKLRHDSVHGRSPSPLIGEVRDPPFTEFSRLALIQEVSRLRVTNKEACRAVNQLIDNASNRKLNRLPSEKNFSPDQYHSTNEVEPKRRLRTLGVDVDAGQPSMSAEDDKRSSHDLFQQIHVFSKLFQKLCIEKDSMEVKIRLLEEERDSWHDHGQNLVRL